MKDIIDLILKESNPSCRTQTGKFLEKLSRGCDDEQRLLICIGIDVKNRIIDKNTLKDIFEMIDYDGYRECKNGACLGHGCTEKNNSEDLIGKFKCNRLLSAYEKAVTLNGKFTGVVYDNSVKLKERFCRVITIANFSRYIYSEIPRDDVKLKVSDAKKDITDNQLIDLFMPNTAEPTRGLVWVTLLNDLLALKEESEKNGGNPANEAINRLGLTIDNYEYAYMEYSEDFNETVFQPCHLCNSWNRNSFYLSYKLSDRYGRTRPRKGDDEKFQMKEKVHYAVDDPGKYKYNVKYLGIVNDNSLNISNFVDDAMKRYTL